MVNLRRRGAVMARALAFHSQKPSWRRTVAPCTLPAFATRYPSRGSVSAGASSSGVEITAKQPRAGVRKVSYDVPSSHPLMRCAPTDTVCFQMILPAARTTVNGEAVRVESRLSRNRYNDPTSSWRSQHQGRSGRALSHGARITRVYEGASETGGSHHPQNLAVMALRRQSIPHLL